MLQTISRAEALRRDKKVEAVEEDIQNGIFRDFSLKIILSG